MVALILGSPFAAVILAKWLSGFANHTGVSWWLFILGDLFIVLIALMTIIFRIIKVSRTNPVVALKYE